MSWDATDADEKFKDLSARGIIPRQQEAEKKLIKKQLLSPQT